MESSTSDTCSRRILRKARKSSELSVVGKYLKYFIFNYQQLFYTIYSNTFFSRDIKDSAFKWFYSAFIRINLKHAISWIFGCIYFLKNVIFRFCMTLNSIKLYLPKDQPVLL